MESNYQEEFLKLSKGLYDFYLTHGETSGEVFCKKLKERSNFDVLFANLNKSYKNSIDPIMVYGHLNPLISETDKNLCLNRLSEFYKILNIKDVPKKIKK